MNTVYFDRQKSLDFSKTLKERVNNYFKEAGISKKGNWKMWLKSLVILSIYLVPYFLMVLGYVTGPPFLLLGLWVLMGVGMTGIGCSIMHDANHGAYSNNPMVNKVMGQMVNLIGGSSINWKIQHNVLHHTYTNIDGLDEDIDPGLLMRLSPHKKRFALHRFQHIYGWFLYGLMTFLWLTTKDYRQLIRYNEMGLLKGQKVSFGTQLFRLIFGKVLYYFFFLAIPLLVIDSPWWMILIFFVAMHFTTGLLFGMIFQTAHVMPGREYPVPEESGNIEENWMIHQMNTTQNYAPKSRIFAWFVGGLNYQVEHHLFPSICHIHYPKISGIVKNTANEFGVPYQSARTFVGALVEHGKMLKHLGTAI